MNSETIYDHHYIFSLQDHHHISIVSLHHHHHHHHHHHISIVSSTTTTTTTFLLFPPPPPHFCCFHSSYCFPPDRPIWPTSGQNSQRCKKRLVSLKETCLVLLRVIISRVFQLILFNFFFSILFCVLIIISEGCSLGMAVGPILMKFWACSLAWLTD